MGISLIAQHIETINKNKIILITGGILKCAMTIQNECDNCKILSRAHWEYIDEKYPWYKSDRARVNGPLDIASSAGAS